MDVIATHRTTTACGPDVRAIIEGQHEFLALIENLSDYVAMYTPDGVVIYVNPAGRALVGLDDADDIAQTMIADYYTLETWQRVRQEVTPAVFETDRWDGELEIQHFKTGAVILTQASVFTVRHPQTKHVMCLATVQRDVTLQTWLQEQVSQNIARIQEQNLELEIQKGELYHGIQQLNMANAKLEALATTDGLTGAKNHRAFQEKLAEDVRRSLRYMQPLSLVILDVDRFKQYNDAFGHPAGDQVLITVARILEEAARVTDYVARYGGEEFVIILPQTDASGACEAAERFRDRIFGHNWNSKQVTVSLGIASLQAGIDSCSELIDAADRALYASKQAGRNRLTHFDAVRAPRAGHVESNSVGFPPLAVLEAEAGGQESHAPGHDMESALLTAYDAAVANWLRSLNIGQNQPEDRCARLADLTVRLAKHAGMAGPDLVHVRWGALLHDVGKMGIPGSILQKTGPLSEAEEQIVRQHPRIAHDMLRGIEFLAPALDIPYCHHERWDGTGYPRKLQGNEIPVSARMFAIADRWDTLLPSSAEGRDPERKRAAAILSAEGGGPLDPDLTRTFLTMEMDGILR